MWNLSAWPLNGGKWEILIVRISELCNNVLYINIMISDASLNKKWFTYIPTHTFDLYLLTPERYCWLMYFVNASLVGFSFSLRQDD